MSVTKFSYVRVLSGAVALFVFCAPAVVSAAIQVSASETIVDSLPLDPFGRDLGRVRTSSATDGSSFYEFTDNDAQIVAENLVNDSFGILNTKTVSYAHRLDWVTPPPTGFLSATLTIMAFGANGGDDLVFADSFALGSLVRSGRLPFFSTTAFGIDTGTMANVMLLDGMLHVKIEKNSDDGFWGFLHPVSVFKSELSVLYEVPATGGGDGSTGDGVVDAPEPATLAVWSLLGIVCGSAVVVRRKLRA